jgi:hypothetical protein
MSVLGYLTYILNGGSTILLLNQTTSHRTERYRDNNILRILTRRTRSVATLAILGKLVTLVLKVNQSPILAVTLQNDATALTAVTAIGTSEGNELLTTEVARASTSVARTGKNLHIVHKI